MAALYLVDNYGNYRCSEVDFGFNATYDVMNFEHTRNDETMDYDDYNCFGYALCTYNWGVPYLTYDYLDELQDEGLVDDWDVTDYEQNLISEIVDIAEDFDNAINYEDAGVVCERIMHGQFNNTFAIEIAKRHILSAFADVRLVNSFTELHSDEYGIVYATSFTDFHFGKYYPETGYYTHKNGNLEPQIVFHEDDVFRGGYNSRRIYFAKKRKDDICLVPA